MKKDDKDFEELDIMLGRLALFVLAILIAIIVLLLGGCASQAELDRAYLAQERIVASQTAQQAAVIEMKCGDAKDACKGLYFAYRPQQDIKVPTVTNSNDTVTKIAPSVVNAIGWVAGSVAAIRIADDAFSNAGGGNTEIHNTTIGNENTSEMTTSMDSSTDNSQDSSTDNSVSTNPVE